MTDISLSFSHEVLAGNGEDCFAVLKTGNCHAMCVTDGCGGLGSRRYPAFGDHTGAYAASRLAAQVFAEWAKECKAPRLPEDAKALEEALEKAFRTTAERDCVTQGIRITGSMQRRLPTTFCAAVTDEKSACFLWAGDSRAYVLDAGGLHQCTRDHLKGTPDPFENLYRDMPLSAYISADTPVKLSAAQVNLPDAPCAVILATDGAYSALPTPMEFEMLLWDALKSAKSWSAWQQKLQKAVSRIAQDDATMTIIPCGTADFLTFQQALLPRREALQKQFITPVRRKKGDVEFARERWQEYRMTYDWTEEGRNG